MSLLPFVRHSTSNNGVTLNPGLGSFKVIENGIIRNLGYRFLFAFHSNCSRIFSRFDTIHKRDGQTPHDVIGRAMQWTPNFVKMSFVGNVVRAGVKVISSYRKRNTSLVSNLLSLVNAVLHSFYLYDVFDAYVIVNQINDDDDFDLLVISMMALLPTSTLCSSDACQTDHKISLIG